MTVWNVLDDSFRSLVTPEWPLIEWHHLWPLQPPWSTRLFIPPCVTSSEFKSEGFASCITDLIQRRPVELSSYLLIGSEVSTRLSNVLSTVLSSGVSVFTLHASTGTFFHECFFFSPGILLICHFGWRSAASKYVSVSDPVQHKPSCAAKDDMYM